MAHKRTVCLFVQHAYAVPSDVAWWHEVAWQLPYRMNCCAFVDDYACLYGRSCESSSCTACRSELVCLYDAIQRLLRLRLPPAGQNCKCFIWQCIISIVFICSMQQTGHATAPCCLSFAAHIPSTAACQDAFVMSQLIVGFWAM